MLGISSSYYIEKRKKSEKKSIRTVCCCALVEWPRQEKWKRRKKLKKHKTCLATWLNSWTSNPYSRIFLSCSPDCNRTVACKTSYIYLSVHRQKSIEWNIEDYANAIDYSLYVRNHDNNNKKNWSWIVCALHASNVCAAQK